jgi:hypothetical protein
MSVSAFRKSQNALAKDFNQTVIGQCKSRRSYFHFAESGFNYLFHFVTSGRSGDSGIW